MGNYNGTVRCGHCYNSGHNSRTCPSKLERMQKHYETAKADGSHVDYYAGQLARQTGVNPETGAKQRRRTEYGRTCSYCKESGHNRRKCGTLATDRVRYAALTQKVRAEQRALMVEQGCGVGAMVQTEQYGDVAMWLVSAINITNGHPKNIRVGMTLRPINPALRVAGKTICPESDQSTYNSYKVLSPVTASQITTQLPDDWETSPVDVDALDNAPFAKGECRDHYFWRDIDAKEAEARENAAS